MASTTIRVSVRTRDRVAQLGRLTSAPADLVLSRALEVYERELFWAEYAQAAAGRSAEQRAARDEELAEWDDTLLDGLDHE